MPDGGGRAVLEQVHAALPDVVFLALSVSDAAEDVIAVIRAGARGYVTKTISGRELADAVVRVSAGDAVFSPRLAGFVLDAFSDRNGPAPSPTRNWTCSPRGSARCSSCWPGGTPTRRSPPSCSSRSRPSRRTCPACCARPRSRTATSFPGGGHRPSAGRTPGHLLLRLTLAGREPALARPGCWPPGCAATCGRACPAPCQQHHPQVGARRTQFAEPLQHGHLTAVDDLRAAQAAARGADGVRDGGAAQDQPHQFGVDLVDLGPQHVDARLVRGTGTSGARARSQAPATSSDGGAPGRASMVAAMAGSGVVLVRVLDPGGVRDGRVQGGGHF